MHSIFHVICIRNEYVDGENHFYLISNGIMFSSMQVFEDQKLLREKIQHLGGDAGIERMECALSETRSKYFQTAEEGSPSGSPMTIVFSPSSASSSDGSSIASNERRKLSEDVEKPNRVVRSLFREDVTPLPNEFGSLSLESDGRTGTSGIQLANENEVIVNALLHEQRPVLLNGFSTKSDNENSIKVGGLISTFSYSVEFSRSITM